MSNDGNDLLFVDGGMMIRTGLSGTQVVANPQAGPIAVYPRGYGDLKSSSTTNLSGLDLVDASSDLSVVLWRGVQFCYNRAVSCYRSESIYTTILKGGVTEEIVDDTGRVSANGRFVFAARDRFMQGNSPYAKLYTLQSPATPLTFPAGLACTGAGNGITSRQVSDSGDAICFGAADSSEPFGLLLVKQGKPTLIHHLEYLFGSQLAAINAQGTTILYSDGSTIYRYDVAATKSTPLFVSKDAVQGIQLSDDGKTALLILAPFQTNDFYTLAIDVVTGTLRNQVFPMLSSSCLLSGDGRVAMCFPNNDKNVYRLDLSSGKASALNWFPVLPGIQSGVPGSSATLNGAGFEDAPSTPDAGSAWSLGGVRIAIGGYPAPILAGDYYQLQIQVPWQLATSGGQTVPIEIMTGDGRTVRGSFLIQSPQINFSLTSIYEINSNLKDSNLEVGTNVPANPGEIVSMRAAGLGAVSLPVIDAQGGPAGPFAHTLLPVRCGVNNTETLTEVYFAGLEPNVVGQYRIVIPIPPDVKPTYRLLSGSSSFDASVTCQLGTNEPVSGRLNIKYNP